MNNFKMAARFFKNVLFLFKSCLMQTKRHRKVNVMLKADHKLRLNPIMTIFGDPMGYLLTFRMIFYNDQRLISDHFQALEMTFGGSKSTYAFLSIV